MIPAASLFSGMGASSLGLRDAGFDVRYACEIDELAVATYELNLRLEVDHRDVRDVTAEEIVAACGGVAPHLDGSPPCSSFTTIGRRNLESDDAALYWEAVRIVREGVEAGASFPTFGFENVLGFASGEAYGRHFEPILDALRGLGYRVGADPRCELARCGPGAEAGGRDRRAGEPGRGAAIPEAR